MLFRSNDTATTEIYTVGNTLSLHDTLPISRSGFSRTAVAALRSRLRPGDGADGGSAEASPSDDDDIQSWMDNLGRVERTYRPPPYSGDAVVYRTAEMARWTGSDSLGWERHVGGSLEICRVPGDHLSMLLEPNVQSLARAMAAHLRAVQGAAADRR